MTPFQPLLYCITLTLLLKSYDILLNKKILPRSAGDTFDENFYFRENKRQSSTTPVLLAVKKRASSETGINEGPNFGLVNIQFLLPSLQNTMMRIEKESNKEFSIIISFHFDSIAFQ